MIVKDRIENLIKAIELATKDDLESVEISIIDLCILSEHIQKLQDEVSNLKYKNRLLNISLSKCQLESLDRLIKLDYYA